MSSDPDSIQPKEGPPMPLARSGSPDRNTASTVAAVVGAISGVVNAVAQIKTTEDSRDVVKFKVTESSGEDKSTEVISDDDDVVSYSETGDIVSKTAYYGETHTSEVTDRFVGLFRSIFSGPVGQMYYYDSTGNLLISLKPSEKVLRLKGEIARLKEEIGSLSKALKEEKKDKKTVRRKISSKKEELALIKKELDIAKQEMHNENRSSLPVEKKVLPQDAEKVGYPFVGVPTLPNVKEGKTSLLELIVDRLDDKLKTVEAPHYFADKEATLYEGIEAIAKAYNVPRSIAYGIAANESGYDKIAVSESKAKGIYQLIEDGYERGRQYANAHPELSQSFRTGDLPDFENGWKNRLISTEVFCAHYRSLQSELEGPVAELEKRLQEKDPDYALGTLLPLAAINAYNAGATRIKRCISRFLELDDEALVGKIGNPPYGLDVWFGVISISYGASIEGTSTRVGQDVFMYPYKVLAMGSLIMDTENALGVEGRLRGDFDEVKGKEEMETEEAKFTSSTDWIRRLSFPLAALGSLMGLRKTKEWRDPVATSGDITRRKLLVGLASLGLGAPAVAAVIKVLPEVELGSDDNVAIDEPPPLALNQEKYPEVVTAAKIHLDKLYQTIKEDSKNGVGGWTGDELDLITKYKMPYQRKLLEKDFGEMLGREDLKEFEDSVGQAQRKRKKLYKKGALKQKKYIVDRMKTGEAVALEEDNPTAAYFCEQVGKLSGTKNDVPNLEEGHLGSLWVKKEFIPIMGTLIELVNHQIDLFNADPSIYGASADFPKIPHLSAIKVSGALRSMEQTMQMIEAGQAARTTKGTSSHWTGNALDLGSPATPGGNMVRFVEPMRDRDGNEIVAAGGKLPNQGYGVRTREFLYKMIGRALFAMKPELKEKEGIELLPLHEPSQTNWHLVMKKV